MNNSTMEIMHRGMRVLIDAMGVVEAEQFVSLIIRERFDYTKWQRDHFDKMPSDDLMAAAVRFEHEHPYSGSGKVLGQS